MKLFLVLLISLSSFAHAKVTLTWLGTASYILSDGETNILFDPFVSRPPLSDIIFHRTLKPNIDLIQKVIHMHGISKLDAIVVTHAHYDHVLDAPEFAKRTGALLIGSKTTCYIGVGGGVPSEKIKEVVPGDVLKIGKFSLDFRKGKHTTHFLGMTFWNGNLSKPLPKDADFSDYPMGENFIVSIFHPKGTILSHATPGLDLSTWKFAKPIDVLVSYVLPVNSDIKTFIKNVLKPINAKLIIPVHWDDFFQPYEDKKAFNWEKRLEWGDRDKLKTYKLAIPEPHKPIELF
jgi:L-ascorbate metabolism protein UlaG (beta-lactamase superfamily)